jgi:short-subunit dehydrogenase
MAAAQHVAITGASGGLGRALAEHYAAPGLTLSLTGRSAERLGKVADACRRAGAAVDVRVLDVTDAPAMEAWVTSRDEAQAVDILIANAGIGGSDAMPGPLGDTGGAAREIISVNTIGVVNTIAPLLPRLIARRRGRVALVGSISGYMGLPQSPAYCASKAAVWIYGEALRRLALEHGVSVTTIMPGYIDTPMSQSLGIARPWLWTAERAARRIASDIERGVRESVFPWQLRVAIGVGRLVPASITDPILSRSMRQMSARQSRRTRG